MSRKPIPNLDERIIRVSIEVGGRHTANHDFSTKEIARLCCISEFTIFQHFKNKNELIHQVLLKISEELCSYLQSLISAKTPLPDFIDKFFGYFLAHPDETTFLINYSESASKIHRNEKAFRQYQEFVLSHLSLLDFYFDYPNEEQGFLLWSSLMRRLLNDAEYVLSGYLPDSVSYRQNVRKMTLDGLQTVLEDPYVLSQSR
jgi:AcrR family transcriptional regulator